MRSLNYPHMTYSRRTIVKMPNDSYGLTKNYYPDYVSVKNTRKPTTKSATRKPTTKTAPRKTRAVSKVVDGQRIPTQNELVKKSRSKPVVTDIHEKFEIHPLPKYVEQKKKKKKNQHKATGRKVNPIWSKPLKKPTRFDILRRHHVTFAQEENGYKIYYKFYLVHGNEKCENDSGQYYKFSEDKAGTVYLSYQYFKRVPSNCKKGYKCVEISVKEAKQAGIYRESEYLSIEVAQKRMDELGKQNSVSFRLNTKYV